MRQSYTWSTMES
ncbi:hypothetical protein RDI58_027650 [Solanum bulbocastanum]|uniref:Uncharacterized protein n=1 Tax=Solanum bulbocastanum TaxID=147425 RepID=A0AAN8Y2A2_SOLBU